MLTKIGKILTDIRASHASLAPGQSKSRKAKKATAASVAKMEKMLGSALPADFLAYIQTQDFTLLFDGSYESLDGPQVIDRWKMMNEHLANGVFDDGRIERHEEEDFGNWDGNYLKKVWWSNKWIPFAEDSCGNMKCIDLAPGKNGKKGQILSMEIQDGQGPYIDRNYSSFADYLNHQLNLIKNGQYELKDFWDGNKVLQIDSDISSK
ncbi:MAG: molybdenum cofactor biosynthesis protein MoeA [Bacteroidetes bacterium]|jgi:cell wall assembly regulator SMI1|nr:molybdenum cofactor biosynthesis protein MoeA [Bacteroidota bacterium]